MCVRRGYMIFTTHPLTPTTDTPTHPLTHTPSNPHNRPTHPPTQSVVDPNTNQVGFNVEVGGYFSIKRNVTSIPLDVHISPEQVVPFCKAVLEVFRDNGAREDRQKARLMWLVEAATVEGFRDMVAKQMGLPGGEALQRQVKVAYDDAWPRRDVLGVHPQKQEGYSWVGACIPVGRFFAEDFYEFARVAETYGGGCVWVQLRLQYMCVI